MVETDFQIGWEEPHRLRRALEFAEDPYGGVRRTALRFALMFAVAMAVGELYEAVKGASLSLKEKALLSSGFAAFFVFLMGGLASTSDRSITVSGRGVSRLRPSWWGDFCLDQWPWEDIETAIVEERAVGRHQFWTAVLCCRDGSTQRFALSGQVSPDEVAHCLAAHGGKRRAHPPGQTPALGRRLPLLVALVGLAVGVVNGGLRLWGWWHIPLFIAVAPGAALIGLAGMVEPRVFWSVRPTTSRLPWPLWVKVIGNLCWVVGIGAGLYIYICYL
jgi:hypothetical protein